MEVVVKIKVRILKVERLNRPNRINQSNRISLLAPAIWKKDIIRKLGETKSMIMIIGGVILVQVIVGALVYEGKQHEK